MATPDPDRAVARITAAAACALALVACGEPRALPVPNVLVPASMHGTFSDARGREVIVYDSNIAIFELDYRLAVLEAAREGETYRASRLGRAHLDGGDWIVAPLAGTATLTPTAVRIELTGPEASAWNGEYEAFARVQQREIAALARKGAPAAPGPCQRYRDCVCALSSAATAARADDPFDEACRDAERLLRTAPDDPSSCTTGLTMHRAIAPSLGLALPAACAE